MNSIIEETTIGEKTTFVSRDLEHKTLVEQLVMQVLLGDKKALTELFELTYLQLCVASFKIARSHAASEEIVSDVFLKLWQKREQITIKGSARAYLFASVRNRSVDYLRQNVKHRYHQDIYLYKYLECSGHTPLERSVFDELYFKIQEGINLLPEQCKRIFQLSRNEGLKYREIADRLHISIKTVETQIGRALRFLKDYVDLDQ